MSEQTEQPSDPVGRRFEAAQDDQARAVVATVNRIAYHAALMDVLRKVQELANAVDAVAAAQQRAGIVDDAPLTEEEAALFTAAQSIMARAAERNPGIRLLFPPAPPAGKAV